ncbi:hypothetical protein STFE110948_07120 [Streptobacillus felis]|uniref:hypothetical protein n=1 Tax=Streptobacillus felis TaxID=1384509 RepID=UPI000829EE08|nr:hypothetical protein [Streptobacillus felis]
MLKTKKHLMLLALLFIPVLGFSQDSKNKLEENKEVPSMIAIKNEEEIIMKPGISLYGARGRELGNIIGGAIGGVIGSTISGGATGGLGATVGGIGGSVIGGHAGGNIGDAIEDYIVKPIADKIKNGKNKN